MGLLVDKNDKGAAAVEFALIASIFFMVLFGITEFGRVWMAKNMLTQAAREGARYAAVLDGLVDNDSRVNDRIDDFLSDSSLTDIGIGTSLAGGSGGLVTVTVTGTFHVLSGAIIPGFGGHIPLQAQSSFRYER